MHGAILVSCKGKPVFSGTPELGVGSSGVMNWSVSGPGCGGMPVSFASVVKSSVAGACK